MRPERKQAWRVTVTIVTEPMTQSECADFALDVEDELLAGAHDAQIRKLRTHREAGSLAVLPS